MKHLRQLWRSFFDIRPNERMRVLCTFLYLLFVLFAYYILKPLSRALFLAEFKIDKLPWLYVVIAVVGGALAMVYTKVAVRSSLSKAVVGSTVFSVVSLVVLWVLLKNPSDWLYWVFNIFVSVFSIMLVSQGWLIAANVFNPREAKRLFGLLGIGAVIGAAFGGSFTALATQFLGVENLVLASAAMVLLSYGAYVVLTRQPGVSLAGAKAAGEEEAEFHFSEIVTAIGEFRHLQVIIGIIVCTYVVDVLVEYQFQVMAKEAFTSKEELTAFMGGFFGLYLNLVTFFLQFFLTSAVVNVFGVGGTLQIMPVSLGLASIATYAVPGVWSTGITRLMEAATRYTFNRTGMELLYLPLPAELKNRTKAFVDIFVDRFARGLGGVILVVTTAWMGLDSHHISIVVIVVCLGWIGLSQVARNEYVSTVRRRLESRRLDIESVRISVTEPATVRLLEETARGKNPRQAAYALSLLDAAGGVDYQGLLAELVDSPADEVRAKVFELGVRSGYSKLSEQALRELRSYRAGQDNQALVPAARYALEYASDRGRLARNLLSHPGTMVQEAVIAFLGTQAALATELLAGEWFREARVSADPQKRRLAALAVAAVPDRASGDLIALIEDADPAVAAAALDTAGKLQERIYISAIVDRLSSSRLRGAAVTALTAFGPRVAGTLGDILTDGQVAAATRKHVARVLQHIPQQRSVDALLEAIAEKDLTVRSAVLRALNRLRETAPKLHYGEASMTQHILSEARIYYELTAALAPFRDQTDLRTPAGLLASTLQERLKASVQRLFYLLGLKYPPREIYAAYQAMSRGKSEEISTAVEFLDNVLDRQLKRVLLPLFDEPSILAQSGEEAFGVGQWSAEDAVRWLLDSGDAWLVCCAMAAAGQLRLHGLAGRIRDLQHGSGVEVCRVAQAAAAQLAA